MLATSLRREITRSEPHHLQLKTSHAGLHAYGRHQGTPMTHLVHDEGLVALRSVANDLHRCWEMWARRGGHARGGKEELHSELSASTHWATLIELGGCTTAMHARLSEISVVDSGRHLATT